MSDLTRRRVLASTGALAVGGLAGCVSDSDDTGGNGNGNGGGEETPTDTPDPTDTPTSGLTATIETTETDCAGENDDTVDVTFGEESVVVSGVTPAPTPCHEARITDYSLGSDGFEMTVDVEGDGSDSCTECVGQVAYEATLQGEDLGDVSSGTVRHVRGGTFGTGSASVDPSAGDPVSVSSTGLSTRLTGCRSSDSEEGATVTRDGQTLTVNGRLHTSNPCHEAVVQDVQVVDGVVEVTVAAESTLGDGEVCQSCLGQVGYSASVMLSNPAALQAVTVDHDGSEFTLETDAADL